MKHWQETSRILQTLGCLTAEGRGAALATVVRIQGSAYRRPGAKLLITDDGAMSGSVSGGCLEADVREVALSVVRIGVARLLHYDTGADDRTPWGLGLGCNGAVDIFVQPAVGSQARETTGRMRTLLQGAVPFSVSTVVGGSSGLARVLVLGPDDTIVGATGDAVLDRAITARAKRILAAGVSELYDLGQVQVFTDVLTPPPDLLIFGSGEDSRPLALFATEAGFRVTVLDHRPAYLDAARYPAGTRLVEARAGDASGALPLGPRTYAVVMTHSLAHDREWVRRLLAGPVPYVGVLGPRARIEEMLRQLGSDGDDRVFGPVGLDLGAEGPEQIALSIVAELLAAWTKHEPAHLRERQGVIHAG